MHQLVNCDGLVGPTHHYGGLSWGNIASIDHFEQISSPKAAALEGLKKMETLMNLGILQGVTPPQNRPLEKILKSLNFTIKTAPLSLLSALSSSSSMWCANMATMAPSIDTEDGRVHITPANLAYQFHRSLETQETSSFLKKTFPRCTVHPPLPQHPSFGDEGAANHIRLAPDENSPGIHLFVYGNTSLKKYPARQTNQACKMLAHTHQIEQRSLLIPLEDQAIDQGVFHNDVVCLGYGSFLICHEKAFSKKTLIKIKQFYQKITGKPLQLLIIQEKDFPLSLAIKTYLFNSQLIPKKDKSLLMIAPQDCFGLKILEKISSPISDVIYFDLQQSMQNGGGPACLRMPLYFTQKEIEQINPHFWLTPKKASKFKEIIEKYYPDHFSIGKLKKDSILQQIREAHEKILDAYYHI